jgi:cytochrome c
MRVARSLAGPVAVLLLASCGMDAGRQSARDAAALTGGDPHLGAARIREYGCDACHTIPGIAGADREVGPPLTGLAGRMYIAGVLTNTPENLVKWIADPTSIDSLTAMPDVGVTYDDARHIAAYLYTLE